MHAILHISAGSSGPLNWTIIPSKCIGPHLRMITSAHNTKTPTGSNQKSCQYHAGVILSMLQGSPVASAASDERYSLSVWSWMGHPAPPFMKFHLSVVATSWAFDLHAHGALVDALPAELPALPEAVHTVMRVQSPCGWYKRSGGKCCN